MKKLKDYIAENIRYSWQKYSNIHKRPHCVLWTDKNKNMEKAVPVMQKIMPELLILGDYKPEEKTGPAIWLRCMIPSIINDGHVPVLYLPGFSRDDFKFIESCSESAELLMELQFRSSFWIQHNGRDWSLYSIMSSDRMGLNLKLKNERDLKDAIQNVITKLLEENIINIKKSGLNLEYFISLAIGSDHIGYLLDYLDKGESFLSSKTEEERNTFSILCRRYYDFDPSKSGHLGGLQLMVSKKEKTDQTVSDKAWNNVWQRYCDNHYKYKNIPDNIKKCQLPSDAIRCREPEIIFERYPQWNESKEHELMISLQKLARLPVKELKEQIYDLEEVHGSRRDLIWTNIGYSKYLKILDNLVIIAEMTEKKINTGTLENIETEYSTAWLADNAVTALLKDLDSSDFQLIKDILERIYIPWANEGAEYLQSEQIFKELKNKIRGADIRNSQVILFIDGLRFDLAKNLMELLLQSGKDVEGKIRWTGIPSDTSVCKPLIIKDIIGNNYNRSGSGFGPFESNAFKDYLRSEGWSVIGKNEKIPEPCNLYKKLWIEFGTLDKRGHAEGYELCRYIDDFLKKIIKYIELLFSAGWKKIDILSDHGWLVFPGGLPKAELSGCLTEDKYGRFAVLKEASKKRINLYESYWDERKSITVGEGIKCYRKGLEYAHGGISLQELLLFDLVVMQEKDKQLKIEIKHKKWTGLRYKMEFNKLNDDLLMDIRLFPNDPETSIVNEVKSVTNDNKISVVVKDDEYEGREAYIILTAENGEIIWQEKTIVGKGD